jgi:hypothetical protein
MADETSPRHRVLVDWATGRRLGDLTVTGSVLPSPNGHAAVIDSSNVISSSGRNLGRLTAGALEIRDVAWADDSQHLCLIAEPASASADAGGQTLWLEEPGKPATRVAAVGERGAGSGVTACSMTNDRAIVISDESVHIPPPQGQRYLVTALVQVITLSTGKVIYQHDYLAVIPAVPILVSSSADGRFLLENPAYGGAGTVRDATTGAKLSTISSDVVSGLSGDGAKAVIDSPGIGDMQDVKVVDTKTGAVLWRTSGYYGGFLPRINASDLMVQFLPAPGATATQVILIPAHGTPQALAKGLELVETCPCLGAGSGA